mmetsp:Transcript_6455/g.5545  ORF Transcript_6455/g.5545 Transcript_6455/m.5545 type:complete len:425 (+) Transcript_6455:847-2121(+)
MLRVLDLIAISLIGFPWLVLLCIWDTIFYALNLFVEDVKLIEESEEEKIAHTNALKDGSIDYNKFTQMYGEPTESIVTKKEQESRNPINNTNASGNVGNPVKEGISDTSLKLLKVSLNIIKEDYLRENKKEICNVILVPVELVIKEMYKNLCIQEHINKVCLGIHYIKDKSFFETEQFERIVLGFSFYEEKESSTPLKQINLRKLAQEVNLRNDTKKSAGLRALFWRNKLKNFMIKSDEKWILDQYNQIKRFCINNSVIATPTTTYINKSYGVIPKRKDVYYDRSTVKTSAGSREDDYVERRGGSYEMKINDKIDPEIMRKISMTSNSSMYKQKVQTLDVIGMLNTFIEIEKVQAMRRILTSKTVNLEKLRYLGEKSTIEEDDEFDSFIEGTNIPRSNLLKQCSMISFARNYESLVSGLESLKD